MEVILSQACKAIRFLHAVSHGAHHMAPLALAFACIGLSQSGSPQPGPRHLTGSGSSPRSTLAPRSKSPRQIAQEAFPSIVVLVMQDNKGQPTLLGCGFVLREGLVATNYHVIRDAASGYCKLVGTNTSYGIAGTVAVDAPHDLAILPSSASRLRPC